MAVRGTNSLHFAAVLDNSGLKRGTLDAVGMIQGMGSRISKINPFMGLAVGATTAFIAISKSAYNLSKEFQHAMKEVETISKATQDNFKDISAEVFKLSNITTDSPVQLAKAYYQIVSAGYDGAKGLNLLEVATKSATAGVTDTMTAADGLTTVLNAFKLGAEQSEHVADVLFQTVKLGKTTFGELASNLSTVAPLASANGIAFEQVASAVATLTKQGVPTAQAMTQIRSAIIATNEVLEDGWSKSLTLQEAFQMIYKSANGNQSALKEMLGRVEAVNAVLGVSGKNAEMASEDLATYANTAGAMIDANKRMLSSNTNQWELFGNKIKQKMHGVGEAILESSSFIAEGLNEMLTTTEDLTAKAVKASVEFDNLTAELKDTNTAFGRKKEILAQLKSLYPDYLKSLDLSKVKEGNWATVLREVSGELDKINAKLLKKIELSGYKKKVVDKKTEIADIDEQIKTHKKRIIDFFTDAETFAKERRIKLGVDITDFKEGRYLEALKKLIKNKDIANQFDDVIDSVFENAFRLETHGSRWSVWGDKGLLGKKKELENELKELQENLEGNARKVKDAVEWGREIDLTKSTKALTELKQKFQDVLETGTSLNENEIVGLNAQIAKRGEVVAQLEEISKFTEKNKKGLEKFANSDNEEIKKAYEAKKASLKTIGLKSDDKEQETYEEKLKAKQEAYEAYERVKKARGAEYANKQYANLLAEGENYRAYLLQKLQDFKGHKEQEEAILESAEKNHFRGFNQESKITAIDIPESVVIPVKLTPPDERSIEDVEARIQALTTQYGKARSDSARATIAKQINAEKERLNAMKSVLNEEKSAHQDVFNSIHELTLRQLRTRKSALSKELVDIRKKLGKELKAEKKNATEIAKLKKQEKKKSEELDATNQASGEKTQQIIGEISGGLRDMGDIFSMFGNEEMAGLMNQLAGVGEGVAQMMTGNPADIIAGGLKAVKSALTVEVVSDTAKFEAQIEKLEKAIEKLDYTISKSTGKDRVKSRLEGINQVKELEKASQKAYKAEQNARKQVKFLGIKIGKKGKGSGTDPEKLKEFQKQAEEARRKMVELKEQIKELWVGMPKDSIVSQIIEDLENAQTKVEDFEKSFNEMLRNAMLQQFKRDAVEKWVDEYFTKFAKFSDNEKTETKTTYEREDDYGEEINEDYREDLGDDRIRDDRSNEPRRTKKTTTSVVNGADGEYDLTEEEIKELKRDYISGQQNLLKKYKMMNDMLKQVGAFEDAEKKKKGLAGEISSKLTEDTGSLLAGLSRAKLVELQKIASNSILHTGALNKIVKNTSYNKNLEVLPDVVKRLKNIENLLG